MLCIANRFRIDKLVSREGRPYPTGRPLLSALVRRDGIVNRGHHFDHNRVDAAAIPLSETLINGAMV
jgi:hypothetical protein